MLTVKEYISIVVYFLALWILIVTEEYGPDYGKKWLYFFDDNDTRHMMNFSSTPCDGRDRFFGKPYFYLYTRNNAFSPERLTLPENNTNIQSDYFNKSNDIRVIAHGWLSSANVQWLQNIKNSFLREFDLNVITVDWNELARNPFYPWSAYSTRYIGKQVANLIGALVKSYEVKGKSVHLIGHSLGAHVMGYAGMFSKEKLNRITGLDPARPLFEIPEMPPDFRLDRTDADFVDIIHTCGGVYGYIESYGHADFYPNSGKPQQPGCTGVRPIAESCSHGRAFELFEESIEYQSGKGFIAYPCETWEKFNDGKCKENPSSMGYGAASNSRGNYFLRTRNTSKYVINED